ncbi:MAG: hypothetical protein WD904_11090 [Dehalococcoidia bacterium]
MAFAALAAFSLVVVACGDDDDGGEASAEEIAALEETVTRIVETDPTDEAAVDYWLAHYTERAFEVIGFADAEECRAAVDDCIGEPSTVESIRDTEISGDSASAVVSTSDGDVTLVLFEKESDEWLVDGFGTAAEIPAGVSEIEVSAVDYAYDWDDEEVTDGNVAFSMTNDGEELHMMQVSKTTDDFDIDAMIASLETLEPDALPDGVEADVGFGIASPGATANVVFEEQLEPGNYVFLCFIPDDEGTSHLELGMHSEFTVPE